MGLWSQGHNTARIDILVARKIGHVALAKQAASVSFCLQTFARLIKASWKADWAKEAQGVVLARSVRPEAGDVGTS